jgi:hypothetical protein
MINYFLITHDLNLINNFHIQYTPEIQTLLVGNNHTINSKQHIVCKYLSDNIEHFPKLCSYTAWYAVSKNKLYNSSTVSLLEHDIIVNDNFHKYNLNTKQHNTIIGYTKTITDHYVFYKSTPWLEISLKKTYGIDLYNFINTYKNYHPYWPTTTNITMPSHILDQFIEWFHPMTIHFRIDNLGPYVHERAFFIFCVLNKIDIVHAPDGFLYHKQLQSHGMNDFYGQFLNSHKTKILFPSMIEEYDRLYSYEMKRCLLTSSSAVVL